MKRLLILVALFAFAAVAAADTIYVPDDHGTIQGAIIAALDGDTIIVRPATYEENIDFLGKAITVKSELGPELTIIDGSDPVNPDYGSVVTIISGEGLDSVLDGFTLRYGTGWYEPDDDQTSGGGILIDLSSPTIINNIISENSADFGAGITCNHSSFPVISNNTFTANVATESGGGIGCFHQCSPLITDNTFTANASAAGGGGIYCYDESSPLIAGNTFTANSDAVTGGGGIGCIDYCSPTITNNVFTDNAATGDWPYGGAVGCMDNCDPVISNNVFDSNSSTNEGGALGFYWICDPTIENNTITNNSSGDNGGGMSFWTGCRPTISNNLIRGNTCLGLLGMGNGGGVFAGNSLPTLTNNTITGNFAALSGGGFGLVGNTAATISNTILWANEAPGGSEGFVDDSAVLTISFSDVDGGLGSIEFSETSEINWGAGMIDEDPLFWIGPDGDCYLEQDPCQPGVVNPCVNTGHPFSPLIDGTTGCLPDVVRVDMGYHYALLDTVTADLSCVPDSGVLPFATQLSVTLGNAVAYDRTVAGRIDLTIAGGAAYQSWRAGFTNLGPSEMFVTTWMQTLPALGSLVGANVFELHAEDVTPPPYNQPPFPPSGDIDTASCTVMGEASTR